MMRRRIISALLMLCAMVCFAYFAHLSNPSSANGIPKQQIRDSSGLVEVPLQDNGVGGHAVQVLLNGRSFWLTLDTGAALSAMPREWLEEISAPTNHYFIDVVFVGGGSAKVPSYNVEHIRIGTCAFEWSTFVAPSGHTPLLGGNILERMGYVSINYRTGTLQFRCPKD